MATHSTLNRQNGKVVLSIIVVLLAAAVAWWYAAPHTLPTVVQSVLPKSPNATSPDVYKWRDAKGRLQLTSTPPTDRPYETLHYDPKLNVVPGESPAQP